MRLLWVSLLLAGLCLAKEEEAADDLQAIEGRRMESRAGDAPCSGCGVPDKSSSSVMVPTLHLSNLIGDKEPLQDTTDDLLLKIGDIVSYIGSLTDKDTLNQLGPLYGGTIDEDKFDLDMGGGLATVASLLGIAGGVDGGGGKLGKVFSLLNLFKSGILELGSRGLEIANFVLAIIGLALIVAYVVQNDGELGVLGFGFTGTGTGYGSGSGSGSGYAARSFGDSPVVQGLTNMVYDAISKYE